MSKRKKAFAPLLANREVTKMEGHFTLPEILEIAEAQGENVEDMIFSGYITFRQNIDQSVTVGYREFESPIEWRDEYNKTNFSLSRWDDFLEFFCMQGDEPCNILLFDGTIKVIPIKDLPKEKGPMNSMTIPIKCSNAYVDFFLSAEKGVGEDFIAASVSYVEKEQADAQMCIECGERACDIVSQCQKCGGAIRACCADHESKC